jgi:hypothetical protein
MRLYRTVETDATTVATRAGAPACPSTTLRSTIAHNPIARQIEQNMTTTDHSIYGSSHRRPPKLVKQCKLQIDIYARGILHSHVAYSSTGFWNYTCSRQSRPTSATTRRILTSLATLLPACIWRFAVSVGLNSALYVSTFFSPQKLRQAETRHSRTNSSLQTTRKNSVHMLTTLQKGI